MIEKLNHALHLKITLNNTEPAIWRRIVVPENYTFFQLHNIIQIAMGWKNSHMFEFDYEGYRIGDAESDEEKCIHCMDFTLDKVFTQIEDSVIYVYDFGDYWQHTIILEHIVPIFPKLKYPMCMEGEMQCPPEDCGGLHGFKEMLTILKSKKWKQKREYTEWLGYEYIPTDFNLKAVNKQLKDLQQYIDRIWED